MSEENKNSKDAVISCLNAAKVLCIFASVFIAIGIILSFIFERDRIINLSKFDGSLILFISLSLSELGCQMVISIQLSRLSVKRSFNKKNVDKLGSDLITLLVMGSPLTYTLIMFLQFPVGYCFYLMGSVYNLGLFFIFIMHIVVINLSLKLKRERCERVRNHPQYIAPENKINEANVLLSKTGKNFFVRYYDLLKNWDSADILDEIKDGYEDATKLNKIEAGKKLFSKELNIVALKIIANAPENTVSTETKNKVNEILNKENQTKG